MSMELCSQEDLMNSMNAFSKIVYSFLLETLRFYGKLGKTFLKLSTLYPRMCKELLSILVQDVENHKVSGYLNQFSSNVFAVNSSFTKSIPPKNEEVELTRKLFKPILNAIESLPPILISPLRIMISLMEEIELFSADEGSIPPGIESDDVDSVDDDTSIYSYRVRIFDCPDCDDLRSGYQQKDRKPSQNDKTEHGMEKTVQNQGQSPKMPKSESILKNQQSNRSRN
ncbi:hypothetical protein Tco_0484015 [Tanacetum coccineum]